MNVTGKAMKNTGGERYFSGRFRRAVRAVPAVLLLCCLCVPGARAAGNAEQLLVTKGTLPPSGRIVIRSGFNWLLEDDSLFVPVAREVGEELEERGLTVVETAPSLPAEPPRGIDAVRNKAVPENKGAPRRIMSVAEAISRMKAMQLAREGRLPKANFKGGSAKVRQPRNGLPPMTQQEMIRFAISQEDGLPELRGQVTIPGRLPEEVRTADPAVADYALTVRFAVLWPASGIPDSPGTPNSSSGLAVGWHLVEMECYALAPVREGKKPERVWSATVQRVAFGAYIRGTAPRMACDAVAVR